jgi:hypothetical protein
VQKPPHASCETLLTAQGLFIATLWLESQLFIRAKQDVIMTRHRLGGIVLLQVMLELFGHGYCDLQVDKMQNSHASFDT